MSVPDVEMAELLARKFHAGQMYGKQEYTYHLKQVVDSMAFEYDDRLVIIAWLHDILEDTECTERLLRDLFDKDIVDAIVAISKVDGESNEDYLKRVKANALALKVKMQDTKCNLIESTQRGDYKRIRKYADQIVKLASSYYENS